MSSANITDPKKNNFLFTAFLQSHNRHGSRGPGGRKPSASLNCRAAKAAMRYQTRRSIVPACAGVKDQFCLMQDEPEGGKVVHAGD
jgi:hypothetical protein